MSACFCASLSRLFFDTRAERIVGLQRRRARLEAQLERNDALLRQLTADERAQALSVIRE